MFKTAEKWALTPQNAGSPINLFPVEEQGIIALHILGLLKDDWYQVVDADELDNLVKGQLSPVIYNGELCTLVAQGFLVLDVTGVLAVTDKFVHLCSRCVN